MSVSFVSSSTGLVRTAASTCLYFNLTAAECYEVADTAYITSHITASSSKKSDPGLSSPPGERASVTKSHLSL